MHIRGRMRQGLRQAVSASADFGGWTVLKSWGQNLSDEDLPALGVFTPRETTSRFDGDGVERTTTVIVQARLKGNDELEDALDETSDWITALALPVLDGEGEDADLLSADFDISGEGSSRIGKIELMFRVTRYVEETQSE